MSARRRTVPVLVAALVMAAAALLGTRVTIDNDISRLLPDSDPSMTRATRALARLMDRTMIDVAAGATPIPHGELGRIADELAGRLRQSGHVKSARSRLEAGDALPVVELLRERAALLFDAHDLQAIAAALQRDAAVATVQELARRIQMPDGAHLKERAAVDPLGLTDRVLRPLAAFGESVPGSRLVDGRITAADGAHVLVPVVAGFPASDTDRAAAYVADLSRIAAELEADPRNQGVRIRHLGAHRSTLDNVEQIKADVALTSTLGGVGVALLAVLCFGRIWLALLALTPAVFGGLCAWGVFSLLSDTLSGAVLGFGAVLIGLTIDFAVHVLFRVDRSAAGAVRLPMRALLMGGTTTSLAFVALHASSLPFVRDVGWFGAVGILAALAFAVFVLPQVARPGQRARPFVDLERVIAALARFRRPTLWLLLLGTPVLAVGLLRVTVDGDPNNLSGLSRAALADQEGIFATWGAAEQLSTVVVEGPTLEAALQKNEELRVRLDACKADGMLREHGSIAGLLPSRATQERRLQRWRVFWDEARLADLRATLEAATAASPFRQGAFAPFVAFVQASPPLLTYAEQRDGTLADLLEGRIYEEDDRWRVMTPVYAPDWASTERLAARLAAELPDATLLNKQLFSRTLAAMVTGEVSLLGLLAFAMVTLVVFAWHGRPLITLAIVLPLLLSLVWTLGLLGWAGVPISLANAIFVVFLFGLAVDYAVFLAASRVDRFAGDEDRTQEAQASVLLCTLTTCAGFGSLALAGHPVMHSIGVTALIGLTSAALATQLTVPLLVGALLVRPGPNGTPGVPNVLAGAWALVVLGGGGLGHLLRRGLRLDGADRQGATVTAIRLMCRRASGTIRRGRRRFLHLDRLLDEPCILVANHESMFDIVAVLTFERRVVVLVKGWIWRMPVMGAMVRAAGYVLAEGRDPDAVLADVRAAVATGNSVLVFPEGRRTRDGRIGRFHNGAFAMARRIGVEVQPLAMVNTRDVVPHRAWWIGDHDARVVVLPPMDPVEFDGEGGDRRMARAARDAVRAACREHWPEAQGGPVWHLRLGGMYRYLGPVLTHYAPAKCRFDPLIGALPALCAGDGAVLVAGGGFGLMTARLALAFPERPVTSVDLDERKLRLAAAALGPSTGAQFVAGDLRSVPLGRYELVLAVDVLHYWDEATQGTILTRLAAALVPGGRLLFRDGCLDRGAHGQTSAWERFALAIGFTRAQHGLCFRTAAGWQELLQEHGLEVTEVRDDLGSMSNVVLIARRTGV